MARASKSNPPQRTSGDQRREKVEYNPVNMAGKKADPKPNPSRNVREPDDSYNPVNMAGKKASGANGSTIRARRGR